LLLLIVVFDHLFIYIFFIIFTLDSSSASASTTALSKVFNYMIRLISASRKFDRASEKPSCDESQFKANLAKVIIYLKKSYNMN